MIEVDILCTWCGRWKSESTKRGDKGATNCSPPFADRPHLFDGQHPFHVAHPKSLEGWHPSQENQNEA